MVKETTELLSAVNEIVILLVSRLKDGVDFQDFVAFYKKLTKDKEFVALLEKAYDGIEEIPEELKNLGLTDGIELTKVQIDYIPKILKSLEK